MVDFRKLINLIESANTLDALDEKYSADNNYLKKYLANAEFDPYQHWTYVCSWLVDNGYLDEINELLGTELTDKDELTEEEPEIFYELPAEVQKECAADTIEYLMQYDPADAPTWAHMSLNKPQLLPRLTWLVHFTDEPYAIARDGFTIGMDQMDKLGLTTWFTNEGKKYGGYNFAFIADSRYAQSAAHDGKYGHSAVIFQNSGVHAYHHADEEDQIVFWGKDVSPKDVIVLTHDYDDWTVHAKRNLRNGTSALYTGSFQSCVDWVEQNYTQYRRYLSSQ